MSLKNLYANNMSNISLKQLKELIEKDSYIDKIIFEMLQVKTNMQNNIKIMKKVI